MNRLLFLSLFLLAGCESKIELHDANTAIPLILEQLKDKPSGFCVSPKLYKNHIKLPYHIWICKD